MNIYNLDSVQGKVCISASFRVLSSGILIYDMTYLLTEIGLTHGSSSTAHIYT